MTNELLCPACQCDFNEQLNGVRPLVDPVDGDATICVRCRNVNVFVITDGLVSLRDATTEEIVALNEFTPFVWVRDYIAYMHEGGMFNG